MAIEWQRQELEVIRVSTREFGQLLIIIYVRSLLFCCMVRMCWECLERFPLHWFQKKPLVSDPGMHHGTCVSHVGIANPLWWAKRSRHSWRMGNPQFYVSGKRPIHCYIKTRDLLHKSFMDSKYKSFRNEGCSYKIITKSGLRVN